MKRDIVKYACINALATALYIGLISTFLFYVPRYFAFAEKPDTVFAPILMLMLFVFSAAVTSILILGRPILWYLDGRKKDSIILLFSTLFAFFVIILAAFVLFALQA